MSTMKLFAKIVGLKAVKGMLPLVFSIDINTHNDRK